jgi:hypothetical protein
MRTILLILLLACGVMAQAPPPASPISYAKNKQWHNIMDYGAKNDSTSGAATIQAFHQAITAAGAGGTVYVPPGKFLFDSTLTGITSRLNIICAQEAQLYFQVEAQDTLRGLNGIYMDSVSYVTWTGGHIIGDADSLALVANQQYRANGILVQTGNHVTITGVEVSGFEYGIKFIGDPNDAGGGQTEYSTIQNCNVHHNQRDNIILSSSSYNLVRDNKSYEAGYIDYGTDDSTYLSWNVNSGDVGSGVSIRQFTFHGTEDTCWYNVIERNEIWNCRGQGILLWREDTLTEDIRHTAITNNKIHDIRYSGINIASAPNTLIDHNVVWDCNRPNNIAGNVYIEATYNNDGIHIELMSHNTTVFANTVFDTKVLDTAAIDEAITYCGIQLGDGSPKSDSITESAVEPAPDSCIVINNCFYNTKRFQKAVLDSTDTEDWWYTHRQIDGYVVDGIGGTDTLWRTDVRLYRDGRDNMAIDSFSLKTAVVRGNTYMYGPYYEIDRFPIAGTPTAGYVPKLTVSGGDTTLTWSADATAAAGSGIDSATAIALMRDTGMAIAGDFIDTTSINIQMSDSTGYADTARIADSAGGAARATTADSAVIAAEAWSDTAGNNIAETYLPITSNDTVFLNAIRMATSGADSLLFQVYEGVGVYSSMWLSPAPAAGQWPILTGDAGFTVKTDTITGTDGLGVDYIFCEDMNATGTITINGTDYPADSGTNGYQLTTDGAGNASWAAAGSGTGAFVKHDDSSASLVYEDTVLEVTTEDDTTIFEGDNSLFRFAGNIYANEFHAIGGGVSALDSVVIGTDGYIRWADTGQFLTLDLWDSIVNRRGDFAGGGGSGAFTESADQAQFIDSDDDTVLTVTDDDAGTTTIASGGSNELAIEATTLGGTAVGVVSMRGTVVIGGTAYPIDSGTNGYQLTTDGAGNATWGAAGGSGGGISSVEEVMDSLGSTLPIAGTGGTLGYDDGGDSLTLAIDVKVSDSAAGSAVVADSAVVFDTSFAPFKATWDSTQALDETYETITEVAKIGDDTTDFLRAVDSVDAADETYETITNVALIGDDTTDFLRAVDSVDAADETYETIVNVALIGDDTTAFIEAKDSVAAWGSPLDTFGLFVRAESLAVVRRLAVGPTDTISTLVDAWVYDDTGDVVLQVQSSKADGYAAIGLQNDADQWTIRINGGSSDQFQIVNEVGGATIPFKISNDNAIDLSVAPSLEIPNGANPTTDAAGEVAHDSDDDLLETYSTVESESVVLPFHPSFQGCLFNPATLTDSLPMYDVGELQWPGGIEIDSIQVTTSEDGEYALGFIAYSNADPPVLGEWIDTLNVGASDQKANSTTFTDAAIEVGKTIYVSIPATDIDWVKFTVWFHGLGHD